MRHSGEAILQEYTHPIPSELDSGLYSTTQLLKTPRSHLYPKETNAQSQFPIIGIHALALAAIMHEVLFTHLKSLDVALGLLEPLLGLDGHALDAFDLFAFFEHHNTAHAGDDAGDGDEEACRPGRTSISVVVVLV